MSADARARLLHRRLVGTTAGDIALLDAVTVAAEDGIHRVALFFDAGADPAQISLGRGWAVSDTGSVGDAPWLMVETKGNAPLDLLIAGETVRVDPAPAELGLLEGANAVLAVRNGESAETVLEWLAYHATRHGMTAAVILDRTKPGSDDAFTKALGKGLARADFDCTVVLLDF